MLDGLKQGEVSAVIRSPAGFHLIKLIDRRGGGAPAMVELTHARHILVKTSEVVSGADAERKLDNLRERIVNGADFAELAKVNSDDSSSIKGGDLVAFMSAGAYGAVQASQYNSRPLVPEILVSGARYSVIRRRPSFDVMVAGERNPQWQDT